MAKLPDFPQPPVVRNPAGPGAPIPSGKVTGGIAGAVLAMIGATLAVEGGYVNHKADPGGETNMGITKVVAVKNGYTGPMRTLPRDVAESIYYQDYIVKPGFLPLVEIDAAVTAELYDTGVNMGPAKPSRWFQQSLNELCGSSLAVDGKVGRSTVATFAACQVRLGASALCVSMLDSLDAKQKTEYLRIVAARPSSKVFLKGWLAHRIGNVDRRQCKVGQ